MFCKNCGNQMNEDAVFCNNCGTPVGETGVVTATQNNGKVVEDGVVRLSLKPTFIWGYQILMMFWNVFLTLLFLELTCLNLIWAFTGWPAFFWGVTGIVTFCCAISMFCKKIQYNKINYEFFKTKVEYIDGFFNKEEKEVKYKFIREVTMTQNIFERMFGIGCIRLYTNASSAINTSGRHSQTGKNGIVIHCVRNLSENLKIVKALIDEADGDVD